MTHDTIAALATAVAPGEGSVAIVRISGPDARWIGRRLFRPTGRPLWESHRVVHGHVVDPGSGQRVDEVLLLPMWAPRSFTGEDVVELHCHGGLVAVRWVLDLVLAEGARRAEPGEFSQRAFLNGRLDLTRAEAIVDLISARSRRAAQLAMAGLDGGLQRRLGDLRGRLLDLLADLEARVDFEDDLPPLDAGAVVSGIEAVRNALLGLLADARRGDSLREGLRVAILGRPNVGKSSLLNRLSRRERAIVTDLPGTTRDLLESEVVLEGVPLTLLDTAGIRPAADEAERLGIERSHEALAAADVVLIVFDLTVGWITQDQELLDRVPPGVPRLVLGNKSDRWEGEAEAVPPAPADLTISALCGDGEDDLIRELLRRCGAGASSGLEVALNRRQQDLAAAAAAALARSLAAAEQGLPWDLWTVDLRDAVVRLGEITGEEVSEAVLERVFSRFCIGK